MHQNKLLITKNEELKISVVIAVRNEELTIGNCVESIFNQKNNHDYFEIIIVDDHSTDDTIEVLRRLAEKYKNVSFYQLSNTYSKKEAIKYGVSLANNKIIATTDSDCILPLNWLNSILNKFNAENDFLFGPVVLEDKPTFLNKFQQLDFFAMQGLTFGTSYFNYPILCNAANMGFKKDDYMSFNDKMENKTPSGDDVFLLHQFKKNKRVITAFLNKNFIVQTAAEDNFMGFIHQRIRWASKSKLYKNNLLLFFSYLVFFSNVSMLFIYYHIAFIEQNRGVYIILLLSKWVIDFILLFLIASFFNKRKLMKYFLPTQFLYPFYIIGVGFISQFIKFTWKGRTYNG
ncbi:MAG: glycosyltransferase [Bacteroidetes bacterium]|nr:glycosyltransferase [Bacteroidota bacterium]